MTELKSKPKSQSIVRTLGLLSILIILPAVSWLYLRNGLDYHKALKEELEKHGLVGEFNLNNQNGKSISREELKGKVIVAHFLPAEKNEAKEVIKNRIFKVKEPFKDYTDVVFLSHFPSDTDDELWELSNDLGIKGQDNWFLLSGNQEDLTSLISEGYKLKGNENASVYQQVVIADSSHMIRNYYNINADSEMGRLIEHIVLLTPSQDKR